MEEANFSISDRIIKSPFGPMQKMDGITASEFIESQIPDELKSMDCMVCLIIPDQKIHIY